MSKAIMSSTQIVVTFHIDSNREAELITLLTLLCQLLISFWQVGAVVYRTGYNLAILVSDIKEGIIFTSKVFSIALNSLSYGLGVSA